MCVYCMTGDEFFRSPQPPIWPWPYETTPPYVPNPTVTPAPDYRGWSIEQLKELLDVLERIKKLEDTLNCPCEASKADYLKILRERIDALEKKAETS